MKKDDRKPQNRELEARIMILEAENERLTKQNEEILLLGRVSETISAQDQPDLIFAYVLEQIALIENLPYGAFCELLDAEVCILSSHTKPRSDPVLEDHITLSEETIRLLENGVQIFSEDELPSQGISIQLEGKTYLPSQVLIHPFSARLVLQGFLILADDSKENRLSKYPMLLQRVMEIVISRLDNLSLMQELRHLNVALNIEVDRRVGELRETNKQLREAMMHRLRIEDALLRQRDLITNISEASPVGIVILDKEGQVTYANARAEKVLGLSLGQITGLKYNAPEWKITDYNGNPFPENELPFAKVMATNRPVYNVRHAIEWSDGRRVLLAINAAPLFDDDFQVDGMVAVIEDVTEQIEADAELRNLQSFNASIVQNISEGIFVEDAKGIFTFINPAVSTMLGYPPEELLGKRWSEIIPEDQLEVVQRANERRREGITDQYELNLTKKNGERFPVLVSGSPKTDTRTGEFLGNLAVITDITERKQAEELNRIQHDLALRLSAVTGLEAVLNLCLEAAIKNTMMDVGGIYLVDHYTGDFHLACSQGLSLHFLEATAFYTADSPNVQMMMQGEPVYIHYSELDLPQDDYRIREKLLCVASLPIKHEGKIIANINAASRTSETIPESTQKILEAIAAPIGSAVARAQVEDRLQQRADQLSLLNDVGEKIAAVLDLGSVFELTVQLVHTSFGYQHVALFTVDQEKNAVVMTTIAGALKDLYPPDYTLQLGQGIVGAAALQNETILANDVQLEPRYVSLYPDLIHTCAELSVPIQIGGKVIGIIDAQSTQRNAFDESDVLVMETLADQVAVAIHNANLHQSVQNELIERKRIESALRESEEKFRNIVESSPMGMHMYQLEPDDRLIFLDANPAADLILGVNNRQFIGKTIEQAFPALTQTEVPEKYRLAAKTGQPWKTEQIDYDENGISGAFEVYAFQTSPGRMVALFLEITERKRAEEALRRSENALSSIFRVAPTGIGLISEHILLQVNQRVCEMTAYEREELVGENIRKLYPTERHYEYYTREVYRQIEELGSATIETRWVCKDGQVIDVLFNTTPVDPDNLTVDITFTALDITERKSSEARIQRQLRRLAALNQIDAAITGNLELDRTINILLEQTVRQLGVNAAAILLFKPSTQTLEYFAGYGFYTDAIKKSSVRLGQNFAGRVALERRMVKATDADPGFLDCEPFLVEGFCSYFGVPLIARGQIKGVLEVLNQVPLDPDPGWISFLETLAGQAAIAFENAEMVNNLERSNLELRLAYNNTLEGWARALELRDFETEGHSRRVTELTIQVAQAIGIPDHELVHVQRGALLHDIGKMGIPDIILLKNGPLDDEEWEIMRKHPVYAYEMLSSIEFLRPALDIPLYHHEKWDGTGYPYGIKGENIPLPARVFAVIDVWDALSSDRPYRAALNQSVVLGHIEAQSGKHFDPRIVDIFLKILSQNGK